MVLPLYPQYAMSSTGTALAKLYEVAAERNIVPPLQVIPDFYAHPGYLDTVAGMMKAHRDEFKPDHILFSYHGLPERHVIKSDRSGQHCWPAPAAAMPSHPRTAAATGRSATPRLEAWWSGSASSPTGTVRASSPASAGPRGFNLTPTRSSPSLNAASSA